jgi:hypothetical protein
VKKSEAQSKLTKPFTKAQSPTECARHWLQNVVKTRCKQIWSSSKTLVKSFTPRLNNLNKKLRTPSAVTKKSAWRNRSNIRIPSTFWMKSTLISSASWKRFSAPLARRKRNEVH